MVLMSQSWNHHPWRDMAVFESLDAGRGLETYLRDNGCDTRINDDKFFRYFLFLRPPQITYRVQVRQNHFANAISLLASRPPAMLAKAIHCPSCDSLRINYPQMTRRFILPTILLHLGIIFRVIEHECYCETCHHMWHLPQDEARAAIRHAKA